MIDQRPAGVLTDAEIDAEIKVIIRRLGELRSEKRRRLRSTGDLTKA